MAMIDENLASWPGARPRPVFSAYAQKLAQEPGPHHRFIKRASLDRHFFNNGQSLTQAFSVSKLKSNRAGDSFLGASLLPLADGQSVKTALRAVGGLPHRLSLFGCAPAMPHSRMRLTASQEPIPGSAPFMPDHKRHHDAYSTV